MLRCWNVASRRLGGWFGAGLTGPMLNRHRFHKVARTVRAGDVFRFFRNGARVCWVVYYVTERFGIRSEDRFSRTDGTAVQ